MSPAVAALALVVDAALGAWLGAMLFFSFVGAPRAFAVLDEQGGTYVDDVFPRYYRLGLALGGLGTLAELARGALAGFDLPTLAVVALAAVASLLFAFSLEVLLPRMETAGDDAFARYHRQTVALNGLSMLAVMAALVGTHLPG